jgi:hypothetical protein
MFGIDGEDPVDWKVSASVADGVEFRALRNEVNFRFFNSGMPFSITCLTSSNSMLAVVQAESSPISYEGKITTLNTEYFKFLYLNYI